MSHNLEVARSLLTSTAALWRGSMSTRPAPQQPEKLLKLYEFEGCPYCRLVREALSELDLDVMILPCPKGGSRFRDELQATGGKLQVPFLVDDNTGVQLYESQDIIAYLQQTYGQRDPATHALSRPLHLISSMAASAVRPTRGMRAQPSKAPEQALELYSFEASPYARLVREVMSELELPYTLRNTAKARMSDMGPPAIRDRLLKAPMNTSRNRTQLAERTGVVQVPFLIDPNTGVEMFESAKIIQYLRKTYGA